MKKILLLATALLASILLVACGGEKKLESFKVEIGFTVEGDTLSSVTGNITLPTTFTGGVTVTWVSNDPEIIEITGTVHHEKIKLGETKVVVLIPTLHSKDGKNELAKSPINVTVKGSKTEGEEPGELVLFQKFSKKGGAANYHYSATEGTLDILEDVSGVTVPIVGKNFANHVGSDEFPESIRVLGKTNAGGIGGYVNFDITGVKNVKFTLVKTFNNTDFNDYDKVTYSEYVDGAWRVIEDITADVNSNIPGATFTKDVTFSPNATKFSLRVFAPESYVEKGNVYGVSFRALSFFK